MMRFFPAMLMMLAALAANPALAETPAIDVVIYTRNGELPLEVETAVTPEARTIGLMNRDRLEPCDGMLFLFPKPGDHGFWMKNTRIPLDLLFFDEKQTVVHIERNMKPYSLDVRRPGRKVIGVIELDGGRAERDGIAVGDKLRYELPRSLVVR